MFFLTRCDGRGPKNEKKDIKKGRRVTERRKKKEKKKSKQTMTATR